MLKDNTNFGIHTLEAKKIISHREMINIKKKFGVGLNEQLSVNSTEYFMQGIDQVWIEEKRKMFPRDGRIYNKDLYVLNLRVNLGRAAGKGYYDIMPFNTRMITKAIKNISIILKDMGVEERNRKFEDWNMERLDVALDVKVEDAGTVMRLLSIQAKKALRDSKRYKLWYCKEESLKYANASAAWNIYYKYAEICNRSKEVPLIDIEESEKEKFIDVIRLERQMFRDAVKRDLPSRKISELKKADVQKAILSKMEEQISSVFGTTSVMIDQGGDFGTITVPSIHKMVFDMPEKPAAKRRYGSFPRSCKRSDGRLGINITLYNSFSACGHYYFLSHKTISIAGKDRADLERKVFYKLKQRLIGNILRYLLWDEYQYYDDVLKKCYRYFGEVRINLIDVPVAIKEACRKTFDSLQRFYKAAKTKAIKDEVKEILDLKWDKNMSVIGMRFPGNEIYKPDNLLKSSTDRIERFMTWISLLRKYIEKEREEDHEEKEYGW